MWIEGAQHRAVQRVGFQEPMTMIAFMVMVFFSSVISLPAGRVVPVNVDDELQVRAG